MAEHIQAGRGPHLGGHASGVFRIQQAQSRLEPAVRDAGLGPHPAQIENGHPGGLAAGAGGGGNGHQGLEASRHRKPLSDGRIYVVEEVRGEGGIEIGRLGRVNGGSSTDGHKAVVAIALCRGDGLLDGSIGRFHPDPVEHGKGDALVLHRLQRHRHRRQFLQTRVDDHQYPAKLHVPQIHSHFPSHPGAEADVGSGHLKTDLPAHVCLLLTRSKKAGHPEIR